MAWRFVLQGSRNYPCQWLGCSVAYVVTFWVSAYYIAIIIRLKSTYVVSYILFPQGLLNSLVIQPSKNLGLRTRADGRILVRYELWFS